MWRTCNTAQLISAVKQSEWPCKQKKTLPLKYGRPVLCHRVKDLECNVNEFGLEENWVW